MVVLSVTDGYVLSVTDCYVFSVTDGYDRHNTK
jgi:hypothetical protein